MISNVPAVQGHCKYVYVSVHVYSKFIMRLVGGQKSNVLMGNTEKVSIE